MISASPQLPSYAQGFARRGESAHSHLWRGLQAAWRMPLGPTGLTLFDQSGCGNHGALTNMDPATDWKMTEKGWALDFDGVNDHISFDNSERFYPNSPKTFYALVKPLEEYACIPFYFGAWNQLLSLQVPNNSYPIIRFGSSQRYYASSVWTALKDGNWHSVVWRIYGLGDTDIQSAEFYVDGELQTPAGTATGGASCSGFSISSASTYYTYHGQIASLAVWDRILTFDEIVQLHVDPAALFRFPPTYPDGLPAVSGRVGRGVLTGGRM